MSSSSVLIRPLKSATVWTTGGLGFGWFVPQFLTSADLIFSSAFVTTTMCGGALAILLPLGITRGVVSTAQEFVEIRGKESVEFAFQNIKQKQLTSDSIKFIENVTMGGGWSGQMVRTLASPFLPSTAQMMVRVQEVVEQKGTNDSHVIAAAACGFVDGFLQDKKDTITMIGVLLYSLVVTVGIGVDYSYGRVDQKKEQMKENYKNRISSAKETIKSPIKAIERRLEASRKPKEATIDESVDQLTPSEHEINANANANANAKAKLLAKKIREKLLPRERDDSATEEIPDERKNTSRQKLSSMFSRDSKNNSDRE